MMDQGNNATHVVYINCADTLQYSFASHLSRELRRKGISPLVNSKGSLDLIERASAYVVVFSKDYLSSTSCLDKLVKALQCRRKNSQLLVPVFYGVSPSDMVVPEHESADRVREWSSALQELRILPCHQSREEFSACELMEEIVKEVYERLFPTENIGINSKLLEIEQLLCKQTWGIRRIGIWGMPGIGKTTLAKAVFDQISGGYEASCYIEHFHKTFHEKGLHRLLEEHLGKILKEMPGVCSSITRPSLPRDKLCKKRTLVVLDDVQNPLDAEAFLGGFHWFGPGSLIIITSRDKQVFRLCQINHVYEVQSLNEGKALQLFSQCAFGEDIRQQNLLELSMEVIDYANGNPLALSFYCRELKGKKLSEMEKTFRELKQSTPYKIHDLFKSSYETLNDCQKNIFLDIACFFKGENVDYVMQLLEGCGFFPHVGIDVLVEKCLVTISENRVQMHRLIQTFGQEIVNGKMVQIERGRRLWEPCTIKYILEDDELEVNRDPKASYTRALGTENIEGIFLDTMNLFFGVKPSAFESMFNLRFLKIYCSSYGKHYGLHLPNGLESLPYKLRLLHWEKYPLQSLPQDFNPCHLVELNMPYSQLQKLWTGTKNLKMLKIVRLCHSQMLTEIDDICKAQNVEIIDLQGCKRLKSFPATSKLQHLRVVNLSGCTDIRIFPEVSSNIEELHLQGTGISVLPISIVSLFKQVKLNRELSNLLTELSGVSNYVNDERLTSLAKVVSSNQHLGKLVFLNMKDCSHLRSLPNMVDLESLRVLHLSGCSQLKDIQGLPRNLKELYLAGISVEELPQLPQSLEVLNAHGCLLLKSIPFGFEQLPRYYTFSDCFALSAQVVREFVVNALANVECMARKYQQEHELKKSLAFSFTVPAPADKICRLDLQPGSSVMIRLDPSWRSTLVGFAILVEVAFSEDYHEACDFGITCLCRWKDKEGVSHMLENTFLCWTSGEGVPKFREDHLFVLCDLNLHPGAAKAPDILADLVVFEFFPVNKQKKLLEGFCTVKKCGVHVITDSKGDTSLNMTQLLSPLDCTKEVSDNEAGEDLIDLYHDLDKKDKILMHYILCLFNDEENKAHRITSIALEISSGFQVLADKSLIHISPYGIIVQSQLLGKLGTGVNRGSTGPSTLPESSKDLDRNLKEVLTTSSSWDNQTKMNYDALEDINETPSKNSGELVGMEDHVADMSTLSRSKSKEVKKVEISDLSGKGSLTSSRIAITDFFIGEIAKELLKQLFLISAKTWRYKNTAENLIILIENIYPTLKEIQYSGVELPAHRQAQIRMLTDTLEKGKKLAEKVLTSHQWNMFRQLSLAKKMEKLEKTISDFLKGQILAHILADIHLLRANADKRLDRVVMNFDKRSEYLDSMKIGGGGLIMDAMKIAEAAMETETKDDFENIGVGLELGKRQVKKMMFDVEGGLFGISGMGGVGKTTLARELEKDDEVRCHFENRILFLTVSQSPVLDELRAHIWGFLCGYNGLNPVPHWNFPFEGGIKTRKLVILDDVWTRKALDRLNFPGCTTLVVSRSKFADPRTTYDVEVLREDEAISLFCLCAFGQKSVPPGFSRNLVKQVADECKGLPLAIKVMVASLKSKPEKYWEGALQRLSRGEPVDETHETRLFHQMEASLENLDPKTRECFLDLGAFPEDMEIPIDVLINIWIEVHDLEETTAFAVLLDLSNKNLLTLAKEPRLGSLYTSYHDIFVTQHAVLRDVALHLCNRGKLNRRQRLLMPKRELSLPREWERNSDEPYNALIVSIHTGEMNVSDWFDMEFPKAEVLILNFSSDKYVLPPFISKMSRLRVLVIVNNGTSPAVLQDFSIFATFSKLTSLWLERVYVPELSNTKIPLKNLHKMSLIMCKINNSFDQTGVDFIDIFPNLNDLTIDHCDDLVALPTSICGMTSLKSLSVTNCPHLGSLPKKLSILQALEILRLYACPELKALPVEICELPRLKYLDISQCISLDCLPEEIGNLTTLEKIDMRECCFSGIPSSAVSLESLRHVICDEDAEIMWEEVKKAVPGLRIEAVEISLDWLGE